MELRIKIFKKLKEFDLDVDFCVTKGCTGLMGSSGSGKSMTLKCIAGIERPDSGRIVLNGDVLYDFSEKIDIVPQKRHVGYLFQSYALFPNMTVSRNIMEAARASGLDKDSAKSRTEVMMKRFHVTELADRYPGQISGGQKQRAALARLMALDEDLKGELVGEMKTMLETIEKPVILVSHDKDEVAELCSSLYKIHKGRIIR